jgi:hypothetical protein
VGDEGNTGTATSQALYYASGAACASFSASNLGTQTAAGVGAPHLAGTADGVNVAGLTADIDYCFALLVTENNGLTSVSNIKIQHTLDIVPPAPRVPRWPRATSPAARRSRSRPWRRP